MARSSEQQDQEVILEAQRLIDSGYCPPRLMRRFKRSLLNGDVRPLKTFLKYNRVAKIEKPKQALRNYLLELVPFEQPDAESVTGKIPLGSLVTGDLASSDLDDVIRHMLLSAASGAGKTSLLRAMLLSLSEQAVVWIFDLKGMDFTDFFHHGFRIVPMSRVPENLLDQPNLSTLLCQIFFLQSAGHVIDQIKDQVKSKNRHATYLDFANLVTRIANKSKGQRRQNIFSQLEDRNHTILREKKEAYSFPESPPVEDLYVNTVFVNDLQNSKVASLTAFSLLERAAQYHREKEFFGDGVRLAVAFEEANLLDLMKDYDARGWDQTLVPNYVQLFRELQIALIFSSSVPIPRSIALNTGTKIFGAQNTGQQLAQVADTLALNHEQRLFLSQLKVGEFIAKTPRTSAFPFWAHQPIEKHPLTKDELQRAFQNGLAEITPQRRVPEPPRISISPLELSFLRAIVTDITANYTELLKLAELSVREGSRIRESIVRKKLVVIRSLPHKSAMYFELLELAFEYVENPYRFSKGGGWEHAVMQSLLKKRFEGFEYSAEFEFRGADVLCTKERVSTALEVSLSIRESEIRRNVERNAGNGFKTVLVAKSSADADKIRAFTFDYTNVPIVTFKQLMNCTDLEELPC